ncbi:hypothetical protein AAG906_020462 [Vitis piasezkii]
MDLKNILELFNYIEKQVTTLELSILQLPHVTPSSCSMVPFVHHGIVFCHDPLLLYQILMREQLISPLNKIPFTLLQFPQIHLFQSPNSPFNCCFSHSSKPFSSLHHQEPLNPNFVHEEPPPDQWKVEVQSPLVPASAVPPANLSLNDRAFFLLAFIACTTSVAFTSLVIAAVPTLFLFSDCVFVADLMSLGCFDGGLVLGHVMCNSSFG